jgi:hypothetical protein
VGELLRAKGARFPTRRLTVSPWILSAAFSASPRAACLRFRKTRNLGALFGKNGIKFLISRAVADKLIARWVRLTLAKFFD